MRNQALNRITTERVSLAERRAIRLQRAKEMAVRYRAGETLQEIGDYYGVTRERVRQLLTKELGITRKHGGSAQRAAAKHKASAARRAIRFMRKYGMSEQRLGEIQGGLPLTSGPYHSFSRQKANATRRGIGWDMTFSEWWAMWTESEKWDHRGLGKGLYVMARHGDTGAYQVGNVKIIECGQNNSEYIRRYWKQVYSGARPKPKGMGDAYVGMKIGQSITRKRTMRLPKYDQDYAHAIARSRGWKVKTRNHGDTITVTRIS
jgi:hypothetical protein